MTLDLFLTVIHCQQDLVVIRETYPDRFHSESRDKPGLGKDAGDAVDAWGAYSCKNYVP